MESEETSRTAGKGSALKALVSFFTLWHMDIDQDDMDDMERKFHLVPFVALFFSVFIIIEMLIMQWLSKNVEELRLRVGPLRGGGRPCNRLHREQVHPLRRAH